VEVDDNLNDHKGNTQITIDKDQNPDFLCTSLRDTKESSTEKYTKKILKNLKESFGVLKDFPLI